MLPNKIFIAAVLAPTTLCAAQTAAPQSPSQRPQVKVNVLHVCSPSPDDQKELTAALAKIPAKPAFGKDFEISRGHSTLDPNTPIAGLQDAGAPDPGTQTLASEAASAAAYVRVRHEFTEHSAFSNVQYSFSADPNNLVETLVLRVRDPKDLMEISIEDSASAVASASAMLAANTPASRIKLERFGKSSVVLARCPAVEGKPAIDQTAIEPIFRSATEVLNRYRDALGVRRMVPQELARVEVAQPQKTATKKKATQ